MEKLTYAQFVDKMRKFNETEAFAVKGNQKILKGVIVFTKDSFTKPYTETERSYQTTSDNKAFFPNMISNSIFANCLDGKDLGVRLDWYMYGSNGKDGWKVDYCYLLEN